MTNTQQLILFLFLSILAQLFAGQQKLKEPHDKPLVAYIVSHSHCDPGWLMPASEYYEKEVSKIIPGVIKHLKADPTKRFIWAETSYFRMWYDKQDDEMKKLVKQLALETKQLEFVGGGYVMNDEACPDLPAVVNQMTEGHQYLYQNIGVRPRVGWQIDPFGAAATTATLFHLMGFDYHVINRIDDRLKYRFDTVPGSGRYQTEKLFEFWWSSSKNYGEKQTIFTHILPRHYSTPEYCWEDEAKGEVQCVEFDFEKESTPKVNSTNVHERAYQFSQAVLEYAGWFRTRHLLIPFGDDFKFQDADIQFSNMDLIINEINSNPAYGVTVKYATLSEYFDSVMAEYDASTFPVKQHNDSFVDYFPYTNCWKAELDAFGNCITYWTGYFTTYPEFKQLVRRSQSYLRTAEIIHSLVFAVSDKFDDFDFDEVLEALGEMRRALAISQHHDAVTGTAKEKTRRDYTDMIVASKSKVESHINNLLGLLLAKQASLPPITQDISAVNTVAKDRMIPIVLFNGLGWDRTEYVKISVTTSNVEVRTRTAEKEVVEFEVIRKDDGYELFFIADLPALGYKTYYVVYKDDAKEGKLVDSKQLKTGDQLDEEVVLENEDIQLKFALTSGELPYVARAILDKSTGIETPFNQQYLQYTSRGDGAYLFRPASWAEEIVPEKQFVTASVSKGALVQELHQRITNNITQVFRLYTKVDTEVVDFVSTVQTGQDKELITRFKTAIASNELFYTDNNAFEIMPRKRQFVKFNDSDTASEISGNYYPMVATAYIKDTANQFTVLTRQTCGVSSLADGELEVMLQRNSLTDDSRGVDEHVHSYDPVTIPLRLIFNRPSFSESIRSVMYQRFEHSPLAVVMNGSSLTPEQFDDAYTTSFSSLGGEGLPNNIHLLSLHVLSDMDITNNDNIENAFVAKTVLRLQHIYESHQDPLLSKDAKIGFTNLFTKNSLSISEARETSLSLNFDKAAVPSDATIHLRAGEIKTFIINTKVITQGWFSIESFIMGIVICVCLLLLVGTAAFLIYQFTAAARKKKEYEAIND